MAKIAGRLSTLEVSADGGSTYYEVKGAVDLKLNGSQAELKSTSHDSGQFEEYEPGRKDMTMDVSCRFNQDDAGQAIVKDAYFSASKIDIRFRMETNTGREQYTAKAFPSSLGPSGPDDDIASIDFTLRISGPLTKSLQS